MPTRLHRNLWVLLSVIAVTSAVVIAVWSTVGVTDEERFQTGLRSLLSGDVDAAAAELDGFSSDQRTLPHRRLLRGGILLRSGDVQEAHKWLSAVERQGELRTPALLLLGECYYKMKRLAEAEACFLQLVRDDPDHPDGRRWLGAIYYDFGAMQHAIDQIQHVIRLDPDDYRTHHLLGIILYDFDKFTDAIDSFREALERSPPEHLVKSIQLDLARALVKNRRFDEARNCLGEANNPDSCAVLAECAFGEGDVAAASSLVEQSLNQAPSNHAVLMLKARIHQQLKQWRQAVEPLEQLLSQDPYDHEARYLLAMTLRHAGDSARSREEMRRMEESQLLRKRAAELYVSAIEDPQNPEHRDHLALICDELGKPRLATMWREAAEGLRVRQQMLQRTGDPAKTD